MQQEFLDKLVPRIEGDHRIQAAWLGGSFGTGTADRYSDLDIHLLLSDEALGPFKAGVEVWLSDIQPLVLFSLMFDGKMVNAMTDEGLRLDMWLHSGDTITLDPSKTRMLWRDEQFARIEYNAQTQASTVTAANLQRQIAEFWRCISLTPSVIGRNELIVSVTGLSIETNLLIEILLNGYGVIRDSGVKKLNHLLPVDTQQHIEACWSMGELTAASLANAQLNLAQIMQRHGRIIANKHDFAYPDALEATVLKHVHQELDLLNIAREP